MRAIHKQAAAEDDRVDIWQYSFETWGADQADPDLDVLNEGIAGLGDNLGLGADCSHLARATGAFVSVITSSTTASRLTASRSSASCTKGWTRTDA